MQSVLVNFPPHATSPLLMTERECAALPWEENERMILLRGLTWLRKSLRGLTWLRKRRDGAIGFSWESFNACFSFRSSADDQSCNGKAAWNTNNIELIKNLLNEKLPVGRLPPWQLAPARWRSWSVKVWRRKPARVILRETDLRYVDRSGWKGDILRKNVGGWSVL